MPQARRRRIPGAARAGPPAQVDDGPVRVRRLVEDRLGLVVHRLGHGRLRPRSRAPRRGPASGRIAAAIAAEPGRALRSAFAAPRIVARRANGREVRERAGGERERHRRELRLDRRRRRCAPSLIAVDRLGRPADLDGRRGLGQAPLVDDPQTSPSQRSGAR